MPAGSKEELDKLAGDYKTIAEKYGSGLEKKIAIVTGSNTGLLRFGLQTRCRGHFC